MSVVVGEVDLLERSVGYLLRELGTVRPAHLARPTPCPRWTLERLLTHLTGSLQLLRDAATRGSMDADPAASIDLPAPRAGPGPCPQVVDTTLAALHLLAVRGRFEPGHLVEVRGRQVPVRVLAWTAALESVGHGWDISWATDACTPIPGDVAAALLPVADVLVGGAERPHLFGPQLAVTPAHDLGRRLLAALGRGSSRRDGQQV